MPIVRNRSSFRQVALPPSSLCGKGRPTDLAIRSNMNDLARYALICQCQGLMPTVEPDISSPSRHTLEQAVDVNVKVQSELFQDMIENGVYMPCTTLKLNIVRP